MILLSKRHDRRLHTISSWYGARIRPQCSASPGDRLVEMGLLPGKLDVRSGWWQLTARGWVTRLEP